MAKNLFRSAATVATGAEEFAGPQVTSNDPQERKLARRLRIHKCQEALKKQQMQDGGVVELEEEKTLLDQQLENSEERIETLLLEGEELVTNIRVANDRREVRRRQHYIELRNDRLQRLSEEAEDSVLKFREITKKWEDMTRCNDPLDIHYDMEKQRIKCQELLEQKDGVIAELHQQLREADDRFLREQRRQNEEIVMLAERIDRQVSVMRNAYREELNLIEQAINIEYMSQIDVGERKWDYLHNLHERDEMEKVETKLKFVQDFQDSMFELNVNHQENYREAKIRLENNIEVLEQELEQIKALCLLNSEKLGYNYQILKKRDDENIIMKAEQKRRINKLQDIVNMLRKRIARVESTTKADTRRLTDEVVRLHRNIIELERKSDHFAEVNERKYQQVWEMNKDIAKNLLDKILTVDRLIHERQLGITWVPPDKTLLEKSDLVSFKSAANVVSELKTKESGRERDMKSPQADKAHNQEKQAQAKAEERLLRHILIKVADNTGFLVEDKLNLLLQPYKKNQKTFIRLNNVFNALDVKSQADIELLKQYFLPYIRCSVCPPPLSIEAQEDEMEAFDLTESIDSVSQMQSETGSVTTVEDTAKTVVMSVIRDTTASMEETDAVVKVEQPVCTPDHILTVDPIYVLKALRAFISKVHARENKSVANIASRISFRRSTISRLLSIDDVTTYWNRFRQIFSPQREKMWDGFLLGLQKYHSILEDRHKLNVETEQLQLQNTELRRLLYRYMTSTGGGASSLERLPSIKRE